MTIQKITVYEDKYAATASTVGARKNAWCVNAIGHGQARQWRFPTENEAYDWHMRLEIEPKLFFTQTGVVGR